MHQISYLIGNLNKEHGGAQQLLYDICRHLSNERFDLTVYFMFGEGTYRPLLEDVGVRVVDLDATSNYDLGTFYHLVRQLRRDNPDVLHTNSPISGIWGRTAAAAAGIEHVVSVEHNDHTSYRPLPKWANALSLPLADEIVGVSRTVTDSIVGRSLLERLGVGIRTIRNGVDIDRIRSICERRTDEFREQTGLAPDSTVVGTVGRLHHQKGFDILIAAFPRILESIPDAELVIVGDGPEREALEALAEESGVGDSITFTGYVPSVFPLLPEFTVAVFPSRWEGLPLAVVEAMAAGRPVVSSDIEVFRETLGETGLLAGLENPDALAEATVRLLEDPEQREDLGDQARQRAQSHLSIDRTAVEYADLYTELLTYE